MKSIKVPKPTQLPSGSWFIRLTVKGRRISITEPTEPACIARAMAIKQDLLSPVDRSQKPTLTKAIDNYIEARQNILSPATIRGYRNIQKHRFSAAMTRPVNAYTERDWQRIVNQEAKSCSSKTLKNSWGFVASVIREETGQRYSVNLPQVISQECDFLQPEEIQIFVAAAKGERYEIPALLALCSLRVSEIKALRWDKHIDLKRGLIHVGGAVVPDENHKLVAKDENKNTTSRRTVPIMIPALAEALEAVPHKTGVVVKWTEKSILMGVKRICKKAGIAEVTTHGLRHSFASLAYHLRMPEKIAMEIGGWANDATMHKIYTHIARSDITKYQNAMSEFYQKSNEKSNAE